MSDKVALRGLTLSVKLSAGMSTIEAAKAMVALADKLGVSIEAKFNEVTVVAVSGDNPWRIAACIAVEAEKQAKARAAAEEAERLRREAEAAIRKILERVSK